MLLELINSFHAPFPILSRNFTCVAFHAVGRQGGDGVPTDANGNHGKKDGKEGTARRTGRQIAITDRRYGDNRCVKRIKPSPALNIGIGDGANGDQEAGQAQEGQQFRP